MEKKLEGSAPSLSDFVVDLDFRLMEEVIKPDPTFSSVFRFFDSDPENPLTPREFLQFWGVLSEEERLFIALEFS